MLRNKGVIAIIFILLLGAIAYNVHFFYRRMRPKGVHGATPSTSVKASNRLALQKTAIPSPALPPPRAEKKHPFALFSQPSPSLRHKRALMTDKWGRNPFFSQNELKQIALLEGKITESEKKKKAEQIPVTLSGIIEVENERMAIINNHVMLEGEKIGDVKLLKVLPAAVWVTVANIRRWVPLPQSRITLVVQQPGSNDGYGRTKEKER